MRDVADAYWRMLCHEDFERRVAGHAFNIGSGQSRSISEIIGEIFAIIGKSYPLCVSAPSAREMVPVQVADTSLLEREIGWKISIPLRRSLEEMIVQVTHQITSIPSDPPYR